MSEILSQNIQTSTKVNPKNIITYIAGASTISAMLFLPISTALTTIALVLAMLCAITQKSYYIKYLNYIKMPVVWILLLGILLHIVGLYHSYATEPQALMALKKFSKLGLLLLLLPIFENKNLQRYSLYAFLFAMLVTFVAGVLKYYGGFAWGIKYSAAAVFKSHIQVNFLMAYSAFLLATFASFANNKIRFFWVGACILASYYVWYLSEGRSGHMVYMVLTVLFAFQRFKLKGALVGIILATCMFFTAYYTADTFRTRINDIGQDVSQYENGNANNSTGQRIGFAKGAIQLIAQKPIIGWGTGSFTKSYREHIVAEGPLATNNPHNEYLNIMVQFGVLGLCFIIVWFAKIYFSSFSLTYFNRLLVQGVVVSIAVGCMFNSWLLDTTEGMFIALLLALGFANVNDYNSEHSKEQ